MSCITLTSHCTHARSTLLFISNNPPTPVTQLYDATGMGRSKGTRLKEQMQTKGYVDELEVQLTPRGRPSKILLPTAKALELLDQELPQGRGSALHRNIQQMLAQGAIAKGYKAQVEKELASGAIVDVHLEKGGLRIAVEVAITSPPGRELAHIANCLADGYDKVVSLFLDETSLETTRARLSETLPAQQQARVTLLPLKQLATFL